MAVLTAERVADFRLRVASGERYADLARESGFSARSLWNAITGKTWPHVTTLPVLPVPNCGERQWNAKLTVTQVREIRERRRAGELLQVLADEFGVQPQTISKIGLNKAWRDVSQEPCGKSTQDAR